jgi:hypothetical protein
VVGAVLGLLPGGITPLQSPRYGVSRDRIGGRSSAPARLGHVFQILASIIAAVAPPVITRE